MEQKATCEYDVRFMKTHFQPDLIANDCFIAKNATLLGEVTVGPQSCVLFGAVIRGDCVEVRIGSQTNIQDLCCIHGDPGIPCTVGDRVTVGHGAVDAEMIRHGWEHYVETSQQYKATES